MFTEGLRGSVQGVLIMAQRILQTMVSGIPFCLGPFNENVGSSGL